MDHMTQITFHLEEEDQTTVTNVAAAVQPNSSAAAAAPLTGTQSGPSPTQSPDTAASSPLGAFEIESSPTGTKGGIAATSATTPTSGVQALYFLARALPRAAWVTLLIVILAWVQKVQGGLKFDKDNLFGWHAWLMTMAFPVAMSESLLVFTAPLIDPALLSKDYEKQKKCSQAVHVSLHLATFVFAVGGMLGIAYMKQNSTQTFPNQTLYSPHSWCGMVVLILWFLQFVMGMWMGNTKTPMSLETKMIIRRFHILLGKIVYVGGLATCALGLQDMQSSDLASSYSSSSDSSSDSSSSSDTMANMTMAMSAIIGMHEGHTDEDEATTGTDGSMSGMADMEMGYTYNSNYSYMACGASLMLLFLGMIMFIVPEILALPSVRNLRRKKQQEQTAAAN